MPTDDGTVGLGKGNKGISTGKVEAVLACLNGIPLHAILRSELIELSLDDGCVLAIGKGAGIGTGTKVKLALGFHTGT